MASIGVGNFGKLSYPIKLGGNNSFEILVEIECELLERIFIRYKVVILDNCASIYETGSLASLSSHHCIRAQRSSLARRIRVSTLQN